MRSALLSLSSVTIILLLSSMVARAASPDDRYEQTKAMSQSDGIAPGAEAYLKSIGKEISEMINKAFNQCLKRSAFSRPKLFNMVLRIDANGVVVLVSTSEEQEASQCTRDYLKGKSLLKPPFAPFHILVDVLPKKK